MKRKCINALNAKGITEGKEYNVKNASHFDYWKTKNDNGDMRCYTKYRFEAIIK